jgi:putative redox protein
MSDAYRVELVTVDGGPTALGSAGPLTVVVDRPATAGGRGLGFNGGQLLYLSIAACISNDIYREAPSWGIHVERVAIEVDGDFAGRGAPSSPIDVVVDLACDADAEVVDRFLADIDRIAEIPASLRGTTPIAIRRAGGRMT